MASILVFPGYHRVSREDVICSRIARLTAENHEYLLEVWHEYFF